MKRSSEELQPIHLELEIASTPQNVFRAATSQTDLRKWWAGRIILSRNIVAQKEGQEMEMRLLQSEKHHLVRYSWKAKDKPSDQTVITFEIEDRGISRGKTGEGILLTIIHDGWTRQEERDAQEKIWNLALPGLKNLLEKKIVRPWWENDKVTGLFRPVKMNGIKIFLEKLEKESRSKQEKRQAVKNIERLCQNLDGQGNWFIKDNNNEIELRHNGSKVFGAMKNGNIVFNWREVEKLAGSLFQDFAQRLTMEQDLDLHIGKVQEKIPAGSLHPDLLSQWFIDIIQYCRDHS